MSESSGHYGSVSECIEQNGRGGEIVPYSATGVDFEPYSQAVQAIGILIYSLGIPSYFDLSKDRNHCLGKFSVKKSGFVNENDWIVLG